MAYFLLGLAIAFLLVTLSGICYSPDPISETELDESVCYSMRQDGWKEEEIEKYMEEYNGTYFPPDKEV